MISKLVTRVSLVLLTGIVLITAPAKRASGAAAPSGLHFSSKSMGPTDAYAWAPEGNTLVYATHDGSVWSVKGPSFAQPSRLIKIDVPPDGDIEQLVWSPDGRNVAIVSPRSGKLWDTIWLLDIKTLKLRNLLPLGDSIDVPGVRFLRISAWLRDGRIMFFMGCGTGCQSLHAVQTRENEQYWEFCYASGDFFWAPDQSIAVVQNEDGGVAPQGLGLVLASTEVAVGELNYLPERQCKSTFEASLGESVQFNSWFSDSRTVLYSRANIKDRRSQLNVWDTRSGSRKVLVADGSSGAVSPDGRYVSFIYHKFGMNQSTKQVSLQIMDLGSKRVVASAEIPTVDSPPKWSPSMGYLAMVTFPSGDQVFVAKLGSHGVRVCRLNVKGRDLSWSADGKYLVVSEFERPGSGLTIFKFPYVKPFKARSLADFTH